MFFNIVSHASMYLATKISHPKNKVDHEENMYTHTNCVELHNNLPFTVMGAWTFFLHLHGTFHCPSYQFKVLLKD
jgi:hypothetical protein